MQVFNETYEEMVKNLFKPLPTIGEMAHHATTGISGEVGELSESETRTNTIEELGDLEFYLEALRTFVPARLYSTAYTETPLVFLLPMMSICASHMLDITKKHWIYGKELKLEELWTLVSKMTLLLEQLYDQLGTTRDEVRYLNQSKLMKRYPSGYTNEAAIARADKA